MALLPPLFVTGNAQAQEDRLELLQDRLDAGEGTSTVWWYGWLGTYSALTVGQGAVYFATDDDQLRANALVGSAGSLLGVVSVLASRLPSISAGADLRRVSGSTRQKITAGEALLDESAEAEAFGRSWVSHGLGFLVAAGQGAVLWGAYDLPVDGAISFAVSLAMSELQIFTQPTRAIDDRREYRARYPVARLSVFPTPGGAGLRLAF